MAIKGRILTRFPMRIVGATGTNLSYSGGVLTIDVPNQARALLTGNTTYYIRSNGSDSNTGLADTAGGAFLTINGAMSTVCARVDRNGYILTFQVRSGTYSIDFTGPFVGAGSTRVIGDQTTPGNCILSSSVNAAIFRDNSDLYISGFKVTSAAGNGLVAYGQTSLLFDKIEFGACPAIQIWATQGGQIEKTGNCTVSGGGFNHIQVSHGGRYRDSAGTTSWTADVAYTSYVAYALDGAGIVVTGTQAAASVGTSGASYYHGGHTITAPGQFYMLNTGTIQANGNTPPAADFFPGTTAGSGTFYGGFLDATTITSRTEDTSPDGAADYLLTYDASGTVLKKIRLHRGSASNTINTTRDLSTASGTQDITGFGFNPKSVVINMSINGGTFGGVGYASSSGTQGCSVTTTDSGTTWIHQTAVAIQVPNAAATAYNLGTVSFITDGIRITWAKTGSPTGTLGMTILGHR